MPSSERELTVRFSDGESTKECTLSRHNTSLYTFWGAHAAYNHVYIELPDPNAPEDPEASEEIYVFAHEQGYPELVDLIEAYHFPRYLDLPEAQAGDIAAYVDKIDSSFRALTDGFPDSTAS